MELKLKNLVDFVVLLCTFNRTTMELKHVWESTKSLFATLLIVPLWN